MEKQITSRIDKMQNCHQWMLEKEARHLLVSVYAALTNAYGLTGEALQSELDDFTENICSESRGKVVRLLQQTGGLSS